MEKVAEGIVSLALRKFSYTETICVVVVTAVTVEAGRVVISVVVVMVAVVAVSVEVGPVTVEVVTTVLVVTAGGGETVVVTTNVEVVVHVVNVVYLVVGRPFVAGALLLVKQMVELDDLGGALKEGIAGIPGNLGAWGAAWDMSTSAVSVTHAANCKIDGKCMVKNDWGELGWQEMCVGAR